ncbi:MAG: S1 RNA-binding domain-containing protein [Anaerolineaceae bacterium]|nr:S1 RNA-binding domain-containing protein [Anaerolineaceae bacterium]
MNSNLPGLGESEEVEITDSTAESEETQVDTAPDTSTGEPEPAKASSTSDADETEALPPDAPAAEAEVDASEAESQVVDTAGEAAPAEGSWLGQEAAEVNMPKRGDMLDGKITATSPTAVYVDVGGKTEGVIPGRELERMNRETLEMLKEGETIPVYVVNPSDVNGNMVLSFNRALEEQDWRMAQEHVKSKQVYEGRISGYNKGGLIVRFGRVRGFVPQSQIGPDRRREMQGETPEERWGAMVNEPISVKVMEVDRGRNRLILSERAATRESRESRKENLISDLRVGEVRTGRVVSLVDFGAFVDVGGAEGLVHLTEMSWAHVTHPRDLLTIGQEVKVEVISVDPDNKRIGLSMKRQEEDPWDTVATTYSIGQLVQGVVTKLTKFGAFVRLVDLPEIEGLVHISELSDQRVSHPREVVNDNETLTLRVVKMDIEQRRLGLSLKRVNSAEYLDLDWFSGDEDNE